MIRLSSVSRPTASCLSVAVRCSASSVPRMLSSLPTHSCDHE